jgi:hypothetical protein
MPSPSRCPFAAPVGLVCDTLRSNHVLALLRMICCSNRVTKSRSGERASSRVRTRSMMLARDGSRSGTSVLGTPWLSASQYSPAVSSARRCSPVVIRGLLRQASSCRPGRRRAIARYWLVRTAPWLRPRARAISASVNPANRNSSRSRWSAGKWASRPWMVRWSSVASASASGERCLVPSIRLAAAVSGSHGCWSRRISTMTLWAMVKSQERRRSSRHVASAASALVKIKLVASSAASRFPRHRSQ